MNSSAGAMPEARVVGLAQPRDETAIAAEPAAQLLGRRQEAEKLARLLGRVRAGGGTLVVRGEAGIGKSALLTGAASAAEGQGMLVLSATGVRPEANLPFAGLHQMLRPLLSRHASLPALDDPAITAAFGIAGTEASEFYLLALAALDLLSQAAARGPIMLIAEDAQWLDRPTSDVLAFIGRRVESDPVVLLAAIRDGYDSPLLEAGLPELPLGRLADEPARSLLSDRFPGLAPSVRDRLLDEAGGNPLALLELPAALGSLARGGETALPDSLPLTARLQHAFAARAAELPAPTRALLLIAAADDRTQLGEIMRAARLADGAARSVKDLVPAVRAHLIEVAGTAVRFLYPLVRSALYQAATIAERHAAHAALAEVLADDEDRRVWHRAAATIGPDPVVAAELEETARRARGHGSFVTAAATFERAAAFVSVPAQRGALLLRAAEAAGELGRTETVERLLRESAALELGPREQALSAWLSDAFHTDPPGDPARVHDLVANARRMLADGDTDLALNLLSAAASRCYLAGLGQDAGAAVLRAADELSASHADPRLLQIQAYVAPVQRGAAVIDRLTAMAPIADSGDLHLLGTAAVLVGAPSLASSLLGTSVVRLREQGRLRLLAQVLETRAWAAIMTADFAAAMSAAEESARLATETAQPLREAGGWMAQAAVAALCGEEELAEKLTVDAERVALEAGAAVLLAAGQYVRGVLALGGGEYANAFDHLARLAGQDAPVRHRLIQCFAIGDYAEAGVRSGHRDLAQSAVRLLEPLARRTPSPYLQVAITYAQAVLADDEEGFTSALRQDLASWPFFRARLQLAFGAWLRRQRRPAESRVPLRAARDMFDALGVVPWAARARQELRASGEGSQRRLPHALGQLTAQELQIAQLAAEGLSNREIGQRLYLSHRTIESHLHRVYPKLGIASRTQLARVLKDSARILHVTAIEPRIGA